MHRISLSKTLVFATALSLSASPLAFASVTHTKSITITEGATPISLPTDMQSVDLSKYRSEANMAVFTQTVGDVTLSATRANSSGDPLNLGSVSGISPSGGSAYSAWTSAAESIFTFSFSNEVDAFSTGLWSTTSSSLTYSVQAFEGNASVGFLSFGVANGTKNAAGDYNSYLSVASDPGVTFDRIVVTANYSGTNASSGLEDIRYETARSSTVGTASPAPLPPLAGSLGGMGVAAAALFLGRRRR